MIEMDALKIFILLLFAAVIAALVNGLVNMTGKPSVDKSKRMARALTLRVGISAVILTLLVIALSSGMLTPNADPSKAGPADESAVQQ